MSGLVKRNLLDLCPRDGCGELMRYDRDADRYNCPSCHYICTPGFLEDFYGVARVAGR